MDVNIEHFCTLFDKNYLPLGLSLYGSLVEHKECFHLWILCMDEVVEEQLKRLALDDVTLVPLQAVETSDLLSVKKERSRGEYCWTLTPFTFQMVFDRCISANRVTYLDADLFFFDDPDILLRELSTTEKHVLITEHAYAPEYDQSKDSGRFCVQFLTFCRTAQAMSVLRKWKNQCVDWCFDRVEENRFGDQKYLDDWPIEFGDVVHVVEQREKTLAPWNINFYSSHGSKEVNPVFYHFHGLRLLSRRFVRLYTDYRVGPQGNLIYKEYAEALSNSICQLRSLNLPVPYLPVAGDRVVTLIRYVKQVAAREASFLLLK